MSIKTPSEKEALAKAIKWCSIQERCVYEAKKKLKAWKVDNAITDKIIKKLVKGKFIYDRRFAHAFASGKFSINQWGRVKIAYELQKKYLPADIISEAVNSIDISDYEQLIEQLTKQKAEIIREIDPETKKRKILFWLISRGFEPELILPKLKQIK